MQKFGSELRQCPGKEESDLRGLEEGEMTACQLIGAVLCWGEMWGTWVDTHTDQVRKPGEKWSGFERHLSVGVEGQFRVKVGAGSCIGNV